MKLFVASLLLLIGTCTGLQYPLQYLYHYRAKVSAGVPEINANHRATSSIRANLRVYVTSETTVAFQLEDVEFLDCHDCHNCDSEGSGDVQASEYQAAWEEPASLLGQHAFGINENGHFVHHAEEKQWVLNFYKSIAGLFNISPLRHTFFRTHNETQEGGYVEVEETVMGTCQSTYTEHKLNGVALSQYEHFIHDHVTADPQLSDECRQTAPPAALKTPGKGRKVRSTKTRKTSKTSNFVRCDFPSISNAVTRVVRSVNLEDCIDRVEWQHSMGSVYCSLGEDQCKNIFSRNSNGVYYVRGDHNGMRLEKAKIKGSIIISPYGYETEHLQTITKQKLALVSVEKLPSSYPDCSGGTCVEEPSMLFTLTIPYTQNFVSAYKWARQGTMKDTMRELLGIEVEGAAHIQNQNRVVDLIHKTWTGLQSEDAEQMRSGAINLNYAAFLMYDFTADEISNTLQMIPPEEQYLVYGVLGEVGSKESVSVFLDALRGNKISPFREVLFFGSLNNNLKSTASLRLILDYILERNIEDHPFVTSQTLVNFAKLVRRLCVGSSSRRDTFVVFAREQCQQDHVLNDFQDFIIQELSITSEFWKQLVFVKTLVNLKTVEATNALLPYALGHKECDTHVRAVAMEALASWNAPSWSSSGKAQQTKITLILLDLLENPAEHPTIRARALAFLASWPLSSTMWSRLALITKRPGLNDLSALTYSLIKTTAEYEHPEEIRQRQFAQHALTLARPSSNKQRYSSFQTWFRYTFKGQVGALDHSMFIQDPVSLLPAEFSTYSRRALGGMIFYRKTDLMTANARGDVNQIFAELFSEREPLMYRTKDLSNFFLKMLRTNLDIEETVRGAISGLMSFNPIKDITIFVPLDSKFLLDLLYTINGVRAPNIAITGPISFYFNPIDFSFTTVNDLGIPVIASAAKPSIYHFTGSLSVKNNAPHTFTMSSQNYNEYYSVILRVNLETMIPWSHSKVATGISNLNSLALPLSPTFVIRTKDDEDNDAGIDMTFEQNEGKNTLFFKQNMPYTLMRDSALADLEAVQRQLKVVHVPEHSPGTTPPYHLDGGLPGVFDLEYQGDSPFLVDTNSLMNGKLDQLWKYVLSPTLKEYSINLVLRGDSKLVLSFNKDHRERKSNAGRYVSKYGQDTFREYELCDSTSGATQQTTGQQHEDIIWEQQSSKGSIDAFQEFESFGSFGVQQEVQSSERYSETEVEEIRPSQQFGDVTTPQLASFLRKLQDNAGWKERVDGYSLRGQLYSKGNNIFTFEAALASTVCYGLQDQKSMKKVFVFGSSEWATVCVELNSTSPKLNDLDTINGIFEKDLTKTVHVETFSGSHCSSLIMSQDYTFSVSNEQKEVLKEDLLSSHSCSYKKKRDPLRAFFDDSVYDELEIETTVADESNLGTCELRNRMLLLDAWYRAVMKIWNVPQTCELDQHKKTQKIRAFRSLENTWKMTKDGVTTNNARVLPKQLEFLPTLRFLASDYEPADYCIITANSIKTYNIFFVNTTLDNTCPSLATTLCESGREEDPFGVAVQNAVGGVTAIITGEHDGFSTSVNNKPWEGSDYFMELKNAQNKVYGYLYRRHGFYKVEITKVVEVIVKENALYIKAADHFRGYLCGLCGDLNMEPLNDMKTPEGCLLTNPTHFLSSWKPTSGFQCITEKHVDPNSCIKEEPLGHDYYAQYHL
ncbi:von Willebrand factor type D domain [Trinorchestia longiramus]|nr:von Willebrand factor type D domain [Trinorchestia longiramus]